MKANLAQTLKERLEQGVAPSLGVSAEEENPIFLPDYLITQQETVNAALNAWFQTSPVRNERIVEAVQYSLFSPSKRLRPLFCLEVCKGLIGREDLAIAPACALEMVHTYSLVHDDLPAMDNDDLRRGKPTNHKVYGDAFAILAGDALLTYAFEVLGKMGETKAETRLAWTLELAQASGADGMVLGQAWDIAGDHAGSVAELEKLHRKKTGALLAASVVMGAIAAGADALSLARLREFAMDMGLAFQIQDDVLDVIGGEEIGKPVLSDARNSKPTYVSLLGLQGAKDEALNWYDRALQNLNRVHFPYANRIADLTKFAIERKA